MKLFALLILAAALHSAPIDGTVINRTSGKPQPSVILQVVQPGQAGMQTIASAKADAAGKFVFENVPAGNGPRIVQAIYQGVLYNKVLMPGAPATGLEVEVFDSSANPGAAKIAQHFILLQPAPNQLSVNEGYIFQGDPNKTFNDPKNGTLQFYLPPEAAGNVDVSITGPGGMPIKRPAAKTSQTDIYKVDYPIRPGETRISVNYSVPAANPAVFSGKILHKGDPADIVVPDGVTLKGDSIKRLGQEPQTKATLYRITAQTFKVELEGTGSLQQPQSPEAAAPADDGSGPPGIEVVDPDIYVRKVMRVPTMYWILVLCLGALAVGSFALSRGSTALSKK
ncbi:MAG: hypothetical protein M3O35_00645 [Acidobacteriota bacterium]|nr:hypothetical protein [Acidobacteriota bacterium]